MRVALLASTIAILAGSPAFAQCVYVACNNGGQAAPIYQQPAYQAPSLAPRAAPGYEEGYAAGLAARPAQRAVQRTKARPATRTLRAATARSISTRAASNSGVKRQGSGHGYNASNIYGRSSAGTGHRAVAATSARRHTTAATTRRATVRTAQSNRAANSQHAMRQRTYTSNQASAYQDPIKDRAATYRPPAYGQSTTMASMMSRSSSYSTTTTWSGPATTVNQGGQVCGWGARIVTNSPSYAQRQAVWVCQCPQGWRPPGY
jgi:hypothetical protein